MSKQLIDARPLTFGPLERTVNSLRGIRYLVPDENEGTGGANGGEGGSGDGANENGGQGAGGTGNSGDGSNRQQQGGTGNGGTGNSRGARERQETFGRQYVEELREEAATNRRTASSEKSRADKAEQERDAERAQLAELKRERAITRTASKAEANADVLLDSAAFARETKDLDLSDEQKLIDAIKAFVEKNPHAAATPSGPGSSGPGRPGGSTPERADNSNSLSGAVGAALAGQGAHT